MGQVINQRYVMPYKGGRRIVRTTSGTLFAVLNHPMGANNEVLRLYKSTDDGATWTEIKTLNTTLVNSPVSLMPLPNDCVSVVYAVSANAVHAQAFRANGNVLLGETVVANGMTSVDGIATVYDNATDTMHAAISGVFSAYPNACNVLYAKSKGTVWLAADKKNVTTYTATSVIQYAERPTITLTSGGEPIIAAAYREDTQFAVGVYKLNASGIFTRLGSFQNTANSALAPTDPVLARSANGNLHLVYQGWYNNEKGIRHEKSVNNGANWSTPTRGIAANNGGVSPSIGTDKKGKVVVMMRAYNGRSIVTFTSTENGDNFGGAVSIVSEVNIDDTYRNPHLLIDETLSGSFHSTPLFIVEYSNTVRTYGTYATNQTPTVSVTAPSNNQTLYENDVFNITGTASDADNGNTVTVRYQINALTTRAIKAFLSDGSTLESFGKTLTFKGGNLYDGATLIAENLSDGVAHTLKVWATDDQGGTSAIREIPFYVVPNRAPLLTVNVPVVSGNIDSDKFMITGTFEDSDGNNTIVSYRLNGGSSVQVAEGVNGPFEFELSFGQLVLGANEIVIEAVDSYGAKVSKTVKLNKAAIETPLLKSTARYKINPPTGSAQAVLLWIQRDEQLNIEVSLNMTMIGEAESFIALNASNTAPIDQASSIVEDEFYYEADSAKDNIIVQIDMTRSSVEVSDAIHLISGVLE